MLKKIVITNDLKMYDLLLKSGDSDLEINKESFRLCPVFFDFGDGNEEAIVCYYIGGNKALFEVLTYVFDNFNAVKVISVEKGELNTSIEANPGDVFLPNTFLTGDDLPPIFLEDIADKNYDIGDFGLLMNGICYSKILDSENENIESDIIDESAYAILTNSEIKNLKDKTVIIRGIDTNSNLIYQNMFEVLELVF